MSVILSIGHYQAPYPVKQEEILSFVQRLYEQQFPDLERYLTIFKNGLIKERNLSVPLPWFLEKHTFKEKNDLYLQLATNFGIEAIQACLHSPIFLKEKIPYEDIDALFFISSTGIATPSIEARIMNRLPFSAQLKRIPIWGLGCGGGASGLARAHEYCLAYPRSKVLVLSVELCSLTFQRDDLSKSNLVGSSLFSDGVACALVAGEEADLSCSKQEFLPYLLTSKTHLLPHSEDVMGWDVGEEGLHVIFSKDIPKLIATWLKPMITTFLRDQGLKLNDIAYMIAHPGGRKVLEAYQKALAIPAEMLLFSQDILTSYGNMSSATIFYVLKKFMQEVGQTGWGLLTALGPGFSSELALLQWRILSESKGGGRKNAF